MTTDLTAVQEKRARMVLQCGHVYGVKRVEVRSWLQARNAGTLDLEARELQRLVNLDAAFAATGGELGTDAECQKIREYEAAARRADTTQRAAREVDAARIAAGLDCADVDYDQALAEQAEHLKRGARTLIARANRRSGADDASTNELEGLRVEILSYRDQLPNDRNEWRIARERLGAAALKLRQATRDLLARDCPPLVTADDTVTASRRFGVPIHDLPPMTLPACPRCQQTMVQAGRCATCDSTDHDQGAQLGMFETPPVLPAKKARAPRAPQPESLFS